jgi:3-methyladenine DNA glycosylase AlkD
MDKDEVLKLLRSARNAPHPRRNGALRHRAKHAFGVPMGTLLSLKKSLGKDHALALALWESGWYEARLLAALVERPAARDAPADERVGRGLRELGRLRATVCFHLFDRTPFAWEKARQWAASPREFVKRGGFAADGVPGSTTRPLPTTIPRPSCP